MTHGNFRAPKEGETVMVECWCQQGFVWLPVEQVRAGRTGTCGRRDCFDLREPTKETT
jgi:hypothetical protein